MIYSETDITMFVYRLQVAQKLKCNDHAGRADFAKCSLRSTQAGASIIYQVNKSEQYVFYMDGKPISTILGFEKRKTIRTDKRRRNFGKVTVGYTMSVINVFAPYYFDGHVVVG